MRHVAESQGIVGRWMRARGQAAGSLLLLAGMAASLGCPGADDDEAAVTPDGGGGAAASGGGGQGGHDAGDASDAGLATSGDATGWTPPSSGPSYVRFCHNLTTPQKQPARAVFEVGTHRLEAMPGQCAPAVGTPCLEVPTGRTTVRSQVDGHEPFSTDVSFAPGTAHMMWGQTVQLDDARTVARPWLMELESLADCHALDFREADLRIAAPLPLEPSRTDGFTFAKPRGLLPVPTDEPGTLVFESADSEAPIKRFRITYYGRVADSQVPFEADLVAKTLTDRGYKVHAWGPRAVEWASATGDSGKPGPDRYVHLGFVSHYELLSEDFALQASAYGHGPGAVDLFSVEAHFSSLWVGDVHRLPHVLKSIAWGISVPADEVPAHELPGKWEGRQGGVAIDWEDDMGRWEGGVNSGTAVRLTLHPGGLYDLWTVYSTGCTGMPVPGCLVQGAATTTTRGRYRYQGGVLALDPLRCELRVWTAGLASGPSGYCGLEDTPVALRLERSRTGSILLGGIGLDAITGDQQHLQWPRRTDGPPGNWDVPWVSPVDDRYSGRPPRHVWNPCGLKEKEPNDGPTQATPQELGSDVVACAPVWDDRDFYELAAPTNDPRPGYFEAAVTENARPVKVTMQPAPAPAGARPGGPYASKTMTEPVFVYWASAPGQKHHLAVQAHGVSNMFSYKLNVTYKTVDDAFEPNDTPAMAKPLALGQTASAYLFSGPRPNEILGGVHPHVINDRDWYLVSLQAGTATVSLTDVPADIIPELVLEDPAGKRLFVGGRTRGSKEGDALLGTFNVSAAGNYKVAVWTSCYSLISANCEGRSALGPGSDGRSATRGALPDSFGRPYKLVVSQP